MNGRTVAVEAVGIGRAEGAGHQRLEANAVDVLAAERDRQKVSGDREGGGNSRAVKSYDERDRLSAAGEQ